MNVLVIFGSTSDKNVYEPLTEDMKKSFHAESLVLSAHRNPQELRKLIEEDKYDLYIAGAGLAAHLPGVMASLTTKPVIGLPVNAIFAGLDSLFSILQMPFGVPVLTLGPDKGLAIRPFLEKALHIEQKKKINVVVDENKRNCAFVTKEMERLEGRASEMGYTLHISSHIDPSMANINFVTEKQAISTLSINVPLLPKEDASLENKALELFSWTKTNGAWTGVNNSRNALLWWDKFFKGGNK